MILSGFSVFSFYDPPKATGMTPAIHDIGLLCVEPGKQRAEPAPFVSNQVLCTMGDAPPLGASL